MNMGGTLVSYWCVWGFQKAVRHTDTTDWCVLGQWRVTATMSASTWSTYTWRGRQTGGDEDHQEMDASVATITAPTGPGLRPSFTCSQAPPLGSGQKPVNFIHPFAPPCLPHFLHPSTPSSALTSAASISLLLSPAHVSNLRVRGLQLLWLFSPKGHTGF